MGSLRSLRSKPNKSPESLLSSRGSVDENLKRPSTEELRHPVKSWEDCIDWISGRSINGIIEKLQDRIQKT
jgi:hypothetical protein